MTEHANETNATDETAQGRLLGAADIRRIAAEAGISPTKKFGQNFVIDPGTVRRIVREAGVTADDHVLEVVPGLDSRVHSFTRSVQFCPVQPYCAAAPAA